jgi:hypothetical protein
MKKIHLKKRGERETDEIVSFIGFIELIIGIIFLVPPVLGAIFFTLPVFGVNNDVISLRYLSTNWTGDSNAMSAAPIYLGLMAIAGTFIVHSAIKNFISGVNSDGGLNGIEDIEITEE